MSLYRCSIKSWMLWVLRRCRRKQFIRASRTRWTVRVLTFCSLLLTSGTSHALRCLLIPSLSSYVTFPVFFNVCSVLIFAVAHSNHLCVQKFTLTFRASLLYSESVLSVSSVQRAKFCLRLLACANALNSFTQSPMLMLYDKTSKFGALIQICKIPVHFFSGTNVFCGSCWCDSDLHIVGKEYTVLITELCLVYQLFAFFQWIPVRSRWMNVGPWAYLLKATCPMWRW